ncbi:MAG: hypothetical protein LBC61_05395 [Candidatus Peribacteria bacterium]|nr:hypothetical protein [Candidatus Peribacteria bacterium]
MIGLIVKVKAVNIAIKIPNNINEIKLKVINLKIGKMFFIIFFKKLRIKLKIEAKKEVIFCRNVFVCLISFSSFGISSFKDSFKGSLGVCSVLPLFQFHTNIFLNALNMLWKKSVNEWYNWVLRYSQLVFHL